ncbi:MAG: transposase [Candidatus Andersenbacteria bacterium]|nr:transposase [Candidatus Andersenbacteria bacterium]
MGRSPRTDVGDIVYHVLNRANNRTAIFGKPNDYQAFQDVLKQAKEKYPMRILAFCLMPNHWHLVLHPAADGQLAPFMRWVTLTHTQRWHAHYKNVGYGHLYQGRYKSFPVQTDEHFLQLVRYVERNAKRANLSKEAEDWQWSSLYIRQFGDDEQRKILSPWPVDTDDNYIEWVNTAQPKEEVDTIRYHIQRGRPYGEASWTQKTAEQLGLQSTFRNRGRPWDKST